MRKNQDNSAISNVSTDLIKKRRRRRVGYVALAVLGVGIATGAIIKLTNSGSALNHTSKFIECAETAELHHHDETCYGTDEYGDEILICGYADYVVHKHNDYCYNDDDQLICELPEIEEHIHDESCWIEERILTCGLEETEPILDETMIDSLEIVPEDAEAYPVAEEGEVIDDVTPADEEVPADATDAEPVDDTIAIDDVEAPLAAVAHVHDDSCYTIRRVLGCGQLEMHTHDEGCFDEYGALICGQLELKEHNHTEACVMKRELTDEEIAALDRADPNEKSQPVEHTRKYEAPEYIVTVTYTDLANIPANAELVVKEITEDDAQYAKIEKEVIGTEESTAPAKADDTQGEAEDAVSDVEATPEASAGETIFKALDISFMVDGVEFEPEDEVKVDIKFIDNDFDVDDEVTVHHITDNGVDNLGTQAVDDTGYVSFATDSFSTFVVTTKSKPWNEPNPGWYQGRELRYNNMENAFLTDQYAQCRRPDGAIGQYASNFHLVAFDSVYNNVHVNGNILAKNIRGGSNFGTNGFEHEVTYVQNMYSNPMMETGGHDKVVVVGSSVPIKAMNNVELWLGNVKAADCGGANLFIKDIDTNEAPFINMNDVRTEVDGIMRGFAGNADVNVEKRLDKNYIRITDPDACGYANFKADELMWKNDLRLIGFQSGKKGSLIINVDCSGKDYWEIPTRAFIFFDAQVDQWGNITNGGRQGDTGEVTDFKDGKVIWNLLNCKEGMQLGITQMTGIVLAPTCDVTVNMMNGNIVARNITVTGETHRTDFTGTTVPFAAKFGAKKTVDGKVPGDGETFQFQLLEYWGGKWDFRQQGTNKGTDVIFQDIQFDVSKRPWEEGDHWYMIRELPGSGGKYTYDNRAFLFHIKVTYSNGITSAYYDNYRVADFTDNLDPKGGTSIKGPEEMIFDNTTSTSVEVQKEWYDVDGVTPFNENLPSEITVNLYQAVGDADGSKFNRQDATATLNAANGWHYKWDNLPRQDASGREYSYYIVENNVSGYELISENIRKAEGTITIKNKREPVMTTLTVDKEFYLRYYGVITKVDDPNIGSNNGTVKYRLLRSCDGGQTWEAYNVPETPNNDQYVEYRGGQRQNQNFKVYAKDRWTATIDGLPVIDKDKNGKYVEWKYSVMEKECAMNFPLSFVYEANNDGTVVKGKAEDAEMFELPDSTPEHYHFLAKNYCDRTIDLDIDKFWQTVEGGEDGIQRGANNNAFITLKITEGDEIIARYRMSHGSLIQVDENDNPIDPVYEIVSVEKWSAKLSGFPKFKVNNGKLDLANYKISEVVIDTDNEGHQIVYDGYELNEIYGDTNDPDHLKFTLKNKCFITYDLPATGGRGTFSGAVSKWLNGHLN